MEDPNTIALNLTFFGTLGVAFVMFIGLFLVFVATLLMAGFGRLVGVTLMALFGRRPARSAADSLFPLPAGVETAYDDAPRLEPDPAAPAGELRGPRGWKKILAPAAIKPKLRSVVEHTPLVGAVRKDAPALAEDWAAAVALADARAEARAKAEAAPEVKVSVRDLPSPDVPVEDVKEVAPLVESATEHNAVIRAVPRSFEKPTGPGPRDMLDTGSLVSLSGHAALKGKLPTDKGKLPTERRRAG
jgi:hypothetical protein